MKYRSLNGQAPIVDFREATIRGQAPDKGLYFPTEIPQLSPAFIAALPGIDKTELAFQVMQPYVGKSIDTVSLKQIVAETVDFEFPLVKINEQVYSLELFHGPTLAFKDVGARFMSRCLGHFSKAAYNKTTVLVATSGDTGGAVANGFLGVDGVEVIILYPSGKVSPVQELQLTTCGQNIKALEVAGSFDDCQAMVKDAFMDADLNGHLSLTSANSINVARWLPQQLYYFFAWQQWHQMGFKTAPVISVPSGNFGNLCAGLMAHASGLPLQQFIAACNANDAVPEYLKSGQYQPKTAIPTISNAMDVGSPSNFERILELFAKDHGKMAATIEGYSISDEITKQTIAAVFQKDGYMLDPHGAVAYQALEQYQSVHPAAKGMILETAHPVKFPETVEAAIGQKIPIPDAVLPLFQKRKKSIPMQANFASLKDWLMAQ